MQDTHVTALTYDLQQLFAAAVAARKNSYSPYSHFAVGAAVRASGGKIYGGCNVENASYGLCCCGERNAIFAAVGAGERELEAICVVADTKKPVSPCGACRQVMSEFKIKNILLGNLDGAIKIYTLEEILPYGFDL